MPRNLACSRTAAASVMALACLASLTACGSNDEYNHAYSEAEKLLKNAEPGAIALVTDKTDEFLARHPGDLASGQVSLHLRTDRTFALRGLISVYKHRGQTDQYGPRYDCRVALGGEVRFGHFGVKEMDYVWVDQDRLQFDVQDTILLGAKPWLAEPNSEARQICLEYLETLRDEGIHTLNLNSTATPGVLSVYLQLNTKRRVEKLAGGVESTHYDFTGMLEERSMTSAFSPKDQPIEATATELPKIAGHYERNTYDFDTKSFRRDPSVTLTISARLGQLQISHPSCGGSVLFDAPRAQWLNGELLLSGVRVKKAAQTPIQPNRDAACTKWRVLLEGLEKGARISASGLDQNPRSLTLFGADGAYESFQTK